MSRKTAPTYVLLNQITLAAASSSVTFSNIPQDYGDLVLAIEASLSSAGSVNCRLNGDSNNNYSSVTMGGTGSSAFSSSTPLTGISLFGLQFQANGNQRFISTTQFLDYSAMDKHKTALSRGNNASQMTEASASRWANTASITQMQIYNNGSGSFPIGSTFYLYGLVA